MERIAVHSDAAAYKALFLQYFDRLLQFSTSITRCREASEEVVSDVFLRLWTGRRSLTEVQNPHLYLYICTRNSSLNRLRRQQREQTFCLDDAQVEVRSFGLDPEQLMITAEMLRRLQQAVQALPPKCRLIFKLVREDGLRYREVAELLQLSPRTVEHQMSIALKKLGTAIRFDLVRSLPG